MTKLIIDYNCVALRALRGALADARRLVGRKDGDVLTLIVGVSGGEDSVVLLDGLVALSKHARLGLIVAHFDHGLREESKSDCEFVRNLASRYQLPFYSERASACPADKNLEAWARNVRYDFLFRTLKNTKADLIVTAHHQKDQAETFLFRLLTGRLTTSTYSIAAIDLQRKIIRPLIAVGKQEITDYYKRHVLDSVVDQTNFDTTRTRNAIRHDLLEDLKVKYNPRIEKTAAAVATRLNEDEDALWKIARSTFDQIRTGGGKLSEFPPALRWRMIRLIAEGQIGDEAGKLGYDDLKRVDQLVLHDNFDTKPLELGFEISCLYRKKEGLLFGRSGDFEKESEYCYQLTIPGTVEHRFRSGSGFVVRAEVIHNVSPGDINSYIREAKESGESIAVFDYHQLQGAGFNVRSRLEGDKIAVWKKGSRSVKKLLSDKAVGQIDRKNLAIVEQEGGEIIWIPGIARGKVAQVGAGSDCILKMEQSIR